MLESMIDPLCLGGVEMIWIRNGSQSVILTEGETRCLISGCGDLIKTVGLTVGMIESLEAVKSMAFVKFNPVPMHFAFFDAFLPL